MSLLNNNFMTFGGESVTGRVPTQMLVYAPEGYQLSKMQQGAVSHVYKLFCDAARVSLAGYHVQNRVLPDGTKVRMESNNGVDKVMVWPTFSPDEDDKVRPGYLLRPFDTASMAGYVADELGVQVPFDYTQQPGDNPERTHNPYVFLSSSGRTEEESVKVSGNAFWTDHKRETLLFGGIMAIGRKQREEEPFHPAFSYKQKRIFLKTEAGVSVYAASGAIARSNIVLIGTDRKIYSVRLGAVKRAKDGELLLATHFGGTNEAVAPSSWRFSPDGMKAVALENGSLRDLAPDNTLANDPFVLGYETADEDSYVGNQRIHRLTLSQQSDGTLSATSTAEDVPGLVKFVPSTAFNITQLEKPLQWVGWNYTMVYTPVYYGKTGDGTAQTVLEARYSGWQMTPAQVISEIYSENFYEPLPDSAPSQLTLAFDDGHFPSGVQIGPANATDANGQPIKWKYPTSTTNTSGIIPDYTYVGVYCSEIDWDGGWEVENEVWLNTITYNYKGYYSEIRFAAAYVSGGHTSIATYTQNWAGIGNAGQVASYELPAFETGEALRSFIKNGAAQTPYSTAIQMGDTRGLRATFSGTLAWADEINQLLGFRPLDAPITSANDGKTRFKLDGKIDAYPNFKADTKAQWSTRTAWCFQGSRVLSVDFAADGTEMRLEITGDSEKEIALTHSAVVDTTVNKIIQGGAELPWDKPLVECQISGEAVVELRILKSEDDYKVVGKHRVAANYKRLNGRPGTDKHYVEPVTVSQEVTLETFRPVGADIRFNLVAGESSVCVFNGTDSPAPAHDDFNNDCLVTLNQTLKTVVWSAGTLVELDSVETTETNTVLTHGGNLFSSAMSLLPPRGFSPKKLRSYAGATLTDTTWHREWWSRPTPLSNWDAAMLEFEQLLPAFARVSGEEGVQLTEYNFFDIDWALETAFPTKERVLRSLAIQSLSTGFGTLEFPLEKNPRTYGFAAISPKKWLLLKTTRNGDTGSERAIGWLNNGTERKAVIPLFAYLDTESAQFDLPKYSL